MPVLLIAALIGQTGGGGPSLGDIISVVQTAGVVGVLIWGYSLLIRRVFVHSDELKEAQTRANRAEGLLVEEHTLLTKEVIPLLTRVADVVPQVNAGIETLRRQSDRCIEALDRMNR